MTDEALHVAMPRTWLIARDDGDVMETRYVSFQEAYDQLRAMYDVDEYVVLPDTTGESQPPAPSGWYR